MKLFLCPNTQTGRHLDAARACLRVLKDTWGARCAMSPESLARLPELAQEDYTSFSPAEADYIVAVGGDGSVLRAAQVAVRAQRPLIGVNIGRLGYLCALPLSALSGSAPDLFSTLSLSRRSLLRVRLNGREHFALNDITVVKSHFGETIELSLNLSGRPGARWIGDGIILSTPTGSTAYNHSAGGPVVYPDVPAFIATPICPHSRDVSPMVFSDSASLRIDLIRSPASTAEVFADGVRIGDIQDHLLADRSPLDLLLMTGA